MALAGGGGAGNVAGGSNPAGTGTSLNYIGNHAYAYSGMFPPATSTYTMLSFTTGSSYLLSKITVTGATDAVNPGNGGTSTFVISLDGQEVMRLKTDTDQEDMPAHATVPFLIPPYSTIELTGIDTVTTAERKTSASIVGRVYA